MSTIFKGTKESVYTSPGYESFLDFKCTQAARLGKDPYPGEVPWDCFEGVCIYGTKDKVRAAYVQCIKDLEALTDVEFDADLNSEGQPINFELHESPHADVAVIISSGYYEEINPKFIESLQSLADISFFEVGANSSGDMGPDEFFFEAVNGDAEGTYNKTCITHTGTRKLDSPETRFLLEGIRKVMDEAQLEEVEEQFSTAYEMSNPPPSVQH